MHLRQRERTVFLFLIDLLAMLIAFTFALELGHRLSFRPEFFFTYRWGIFTLLTSIILLFIILDVYSLHRMPGRFTDQMLLIGAGLLASAVIVTFIFFFYREPVPRAVFILFYFITWFLIGLFRYAYSRMTLSRVYWRVMLVGEPDLCVRLAGLIAERKYLHAQIIGYVSDAVDVKSAVGIPLLGGPNDLLKRVRGEGVDAVIVATPQVTDQLMNDLLECMKSKVRVSEFRMVIEHLNANWFIEELAEIDKRYTWYCKRTFDLLAGIVGIVLALPIILLAALLIAVDSRGPVLYSQIRVGRGGKRFRVWKLRTMVSDADKNNIFWTNDNDDRITRIGRYLRKLHVDELPQLLNILKGDMSLIGPRPEAEALAERYAREIPYYRERYMVTPGITGWAQINYPYGNSIEDTREKLKYDFYYIKNRGLLLDCLIFLRTIKTVVTGKGAL